MWVTVIIPLKYLFKEYKSSIIIIFLPTISYVGGIINKF